jgi:hypothetical protein
VFLSILDTFGDYITPKCNAEEVKSWICYMHIVWIKEIAVYMSPLGRCLLSTNPLLNALIYAGFISSCRERVLLLLRSWGMPWRWSCCVRWRTNEEERAKQHNAGGHGQTTAKRAAAVKPQQHHQQQQLVPPQQQHEGLQNKTANTCDNIMTNDDG